jgi:DNA-binding MarR family transcriptional regulator
MKHNPAFLSREELVRSFVARKEDLAFVLDHLADNTGASSQHLLIVAPRGMGKTTLVLRAAEAVRTEERFSKDWFPLVYAEETYEVTSAGELWLEGLRHLGEQTKNAETLAAYRELRRERDEQRLHDRALGLLLDFAEQQKKRLLLVIENLHMLLGEQISEPDAWRLRKTLQTERRLSLLATATASFDAIDNSEQAFFDQFRVYHLEPLDLEGARHVWEHVAGSSVPAEQMRPLQILTGGNPRLLAILASFAGGMSLRELMADLVRLVDDHTTYFKSNLDSLPAKERKVYVALADLWQPSLAREVAEQARLSPSEASALLNRLVQRGAVTPSGDERRKTYQLAERMYNIYHLLRRSGGNDRRVRAMVDFMVGFYDFMVGFYDPLSHGRAGGAIAEETANFARQHRRGRVLGREPLPRLGLLVALGRWEEARGHLASLISPSDNEPDLRARSEKDLGSWARVFIDAAATGHAREALELLAPSPLVQRLEPVAAALHAIVGEAYRAPREIAEVASDIVKLVRWRTEALKGTQRARPAGASKRSAAPARLAW